MTQDEQTRTVVVKIGSSTLTTSDNGLDYEYFNTLAAQVANVRAQGWRVVIVTSGAIACGLKTLGISKRPSDMPTLQAAASVGQTTLAGAYAEAFGAYDMLTSTVLLTRRDTADRNAYLHARDTLHRLLDLGVVPIVNENDTISVEQIRFGDNDTLAALTAVLVSADLVILMSDIDGLYNANPATDPTAHLLPRVEVIGPEILAMGGGVGSSVGSGGMATKLKSAQVLMAAGIPMAICHGRRPGAIEVITQGESVGTLFSPRQAPHEITPKKLWIALGDSARGAVTVDAGARRALVELGSSLLAVGVRALEGKFNEGDIVDIKDESGHVFARGKIRACSDEIELGIGKTREYLRGNHLLAHLADGSLVHRDDLVVFE